VESKVGGRTSRIRPAVENTPVYWRDGRKRDGYAFMYLIPMWYPEENEYHFQGGAATRVKGGNRVAFANQGLSVAEPCKDAGDLIRAHSEAVEWMTRRGAEMGNDPDLRQHVVPKNRVG
jgi:hypothetical protein